LGLSVLFFAAVRRTAAKRTATAESWIRSVMDEHGTETLGALYSRPSPTSLMLLDGQATAHFLHVASLQRGLVGRTAHVGPHPRASRHRRRAGHGGGVVHVRRVNPNVCACMIAPRAAGGRPPGLAGLFVPILYDPWVLGLLLPLLELGAQVRQRLRVLRVRRHVLQLVRVVLQVV
jgi:hypothetical protein